MTTSKHNPTRLALDDVIMTSESPTNPACAPGRLDGVPGPFQTHGGSHTSVTGSPEPRTKNQSISTIELASNSPVPIVTSFWTENSMLKDRLVPRPHLCVHHLQYNNIPGNRICQTTRAASQPPFLACWVGSRDIVTFPDVTVLTMATNRCTEEKDVKDFEEGMLNA